MKMPGMDGLDTAMRMKEFARDGRSVPILFVTDADAAPSQVLRAYAEGAVDVIQRPLQPEAIRAKVAVFAELYRTRQQLARSLRTLTDLALALSQTRTPEEVAAAIIDGRNARGAGRHVLSVHVRRDGQRVGPHRSSRLRTRVDSGRVA